MKVSHASLLVPILIGSLGLFAAGCADGSAPSSEDEAVEAGLERSGQNAQIATEGGDLIQTPDVKAQGRSRDGINSADFRWDRDPETGLWLAKDLETWPKALGTGTYATDAWDN